MPDLQNAEIRWLESGQPYSEKFSDTYYSNQGGLEEGHYVFVQANSLEPRWKQCASGDSTFTIAELGFGSGLNFILCWQLWQQLQPSRARLHYLAFEKFPLKKQDLQQALCQWPQLEEFSRTLLLYYPDHSSGIQRICFNQQLTLDLYFGDVKESLGQRYRNPLNGIDCWFLDGFNPKHNPSMWDHELTQLMFAHSAPSATLSTYSAAGQVRRNLSAAGFSVGKRPGFGSKREMLVARKNETPDLEKLSPIEKEERPAWFRLPTRRNNHRTAIVVGAGLAGCSTAFSLARRGWKVTLIDQGEGIASGASGNKQAVLQCRLAANLSPISRFYLQGFLFSHRQLNQLTQRHPLNWDNCGVLMLAGPLHSKLTRLMEQPGKFYSTRVVSPCDQRQASDLAKVKLSADALWLPHGGWLDPVALCAAYLGEKVGHPIKRLSNTQADSLRQINDGWQVLNKNSTLAEAEVVVLANGIDAASFAQTASLPLIPVRGQVSQIDSNERSKHLEAVVVSDRYICPAVDDSHCIGASYGANETDCEPRLVDDQENLERIRSVFQNPDLLNEEVVKSRAAVRCNTADYIPVVGAMPDEHCFKKEFAGLARNARSPQTQAGTYLPGLFINTGHGSYGLTSCPLSAEFLASLINNENLPLPVNIMESLSPCRFIIRNLKKQKPDGLRKSAIVES